MSKSEQQFTFLMDLGRLLGFLARYCETTGLIVTGGELMRTPLDAWCNSMPPHTIVSARIPDGHTFSFADAVGGTGILKSKHLDKLAIDLNFIRDDKLISEIELLKPIGEFWQSLGPDNRAGMFFERADYPHFERNV